MNKLYFLHVPKTAGSSVISLFDESQGGHRPIPLQEATHSLCDKLAINGYMFENLKHSWFRDTIHSGVRPEAGDFINHKKLLKKKDKVFAVVRDLNSWLASYYWGGKYGINGWHNVVLGNFPDLKVNPKDPGNCARTPENWDRFCWKFFNAHIGKGKWFHYNDGRRERAGEWVQSNIWQLFDKDKMLVPDYVINFHNIQKGLNIMFEDMGLDFQIEAEVFPRRNKSSMSNLIRIPETYRNNDYIDSGYFFNNDESIYIKRDNKCF